MLGVTNAPEFFSRSGSFRFDSDAAYEDIRRVVPDAELYPSLRLPVAIDPRPDTDADPALRGLMDWATNIVRLPLKLGARESLVWQAEDFPPQFLLFVEHVSELNIQADGDENFQEVARSIRLQLEAESFIPKDGEDTPYWMTLVDGDQESRWMLVRDTHELSESARADSRSLDDATEVEIKWAAPVDRLNEPGYFWAFFPTQTSSLLAGILNAPWKTNEDRQNLLPGAYNDELIDAAAVMVAKHFTNLSTREDPARHLDALPRRAEAGDTGPSRRLRSQLHSNLLDGEIVPNQAGQLHKPSVLNYAPREITNPRQEAPLLRWQAYEGRPDNWAHDSVLTRERLATVRRLLPIKVIQRFYRGTYSIQEGLEELPIAELGEWLEALVDDTNTLEEALKASMAAIQTAELIPENVRQGEVLGEIVLAASGSWVAPEPDAVFLGGGLSSTAFSLVHPRLEADADTLNALKALGIGPASAESAFREVAIDLLEYEPWRDEPPADEDWRLFWQLAREVESNSAAAIVQSNIGWQESIHVLTVSGKWRSLLQTLFPGSIVPDNGSRDAAVATDMRFHQANQLLLRLLGAVESPTGGRELSPAHMRRFLWKCRTEYARRDLPSNPQRDYLQFKAPATTGGPLDVLEALSDEGKAAYTWRLISLRSTFRPWTMHHRTRDIYPERDFPSPALEVLRIHGRVDTGDGILPLSDGLDDPPKDYAVLRKLLSHPQADKIRRFFNLPDDEDIPAEPLGEDVPTPLLDEWPGLKPHLSAQQSNLELVRCDGFRTFGGVDPVCLVRGGIVYVVRRDGEEHELRSVLEELGVPLSDGDLKRVLLGITSEQILRARESIRRCATDEERLLKAVGERTLRRGLPDGLLAILEEESHGELPGVEVSKAAIATYHIGALREYRHALDHLDPPRQWAGRRPAIQFVRSLGFSDEWAGDPNARREPFLDVDGPFTLPQLHKYQRTVVANVRDLIRSGGELGERRGMISMPTGSGKTRVAVQAVVEEMREDGFRGGVLWVADRDELCEQAVEAWREVWASEGTQKARLRISRMWAGQPQPLATSDMHVVVATIQTLYAKTSRQPSAYDFLSDFNLLVFDEAHRSIAPTFTSVMEELGLTRWRRAQEPLLIGLTATPYRGHDERETTRLVRRYGSNRLDTGAFQSDHPEDVISELQTMRVLAQADHEIIEGGEFSLTADEILQSEGAPWLPRSVEERIAADPERTRRIIRAYHEHVGPDWPALVFATSVEHAQTVAALLTRDGVKARAVSANTETSVRRRIVEEFRAGEIDALVNYGIFREGFDAPRTRAIVVARPVYSPNLYFQMIGRGLRGVKNGGNDRCLILNVRDNIANYERKLAFSELDWLWA